MPYTRNELIFENFSEIFYVGPKRGLVTVHPEMQAGTPEITRTGRYLIFGIHPEHGSFQCIIQRTDMHVWQAVFKPSYMSSHLIAWIGERIEWNQRSYLK